MSPRVYVRKIIDPDNPFMYIELENGCFVMLGGPNHGGICGKMWSDRTFKMVDEGQYTLWERVA